MKLSIFHFSSVHGILQARLLEWVAIPFSKGSSWPRDRTRFSYIAGRFFTELYKNGIQKSMHLPFSLKFKTLTLCTPSPTVSTTKIWQ